MVDYDATQSIGFRKEDIVETDPIDAVDAKYWKFGRLGISNVFPQEEHIWVPLFYGDRDPGAIVLQGSVVKAIIGFVPVNLVPWYHFLGACSTDASHIHTITGINSGNLETQTIRSESRGGSADKFWSTVGNRCQMLNFSLDLRNRNTPAVQSLGYQGITTLDPNTTIPMSLTTTHTTGVKYPTATGAMGGTELDDEYLPDTNFSLKWDYGGGGETEYKAAALAFSYMGINDLKPYGKQNQIDFEKLYEGQRGHIIGLEIRMGKDSQIWDDYIARTLHDLRLKIYNTSTNYMQLDITDIGINKPNPVTSPIRDERIYRIEGIAKSIQVTGIDGITDYGTGGVEEFYGETS